MLSNLQKKSAMWEKSYKPETWEQERCSSLSVSVTVIVI